MNKLLFVHTEYHPCGSTRTVKVAPREEVEQNGWDVSGKADFWSSGKNYFREAFDPNVVTCPVCQGAGEVLAAKGSAVCELCRGDGEIDLAATTPGEFTAGELRSIAGAIDEYVRGYGHHALTPSNYLYWIPLLASSWPSPQELAEAVKLEQAGRREEAVKAAMRLMPAPPAMHALRFLAAWEDEGCRG